MVVAERVVGEERLEKYFGMTAEALEKAGAAIDASSPDREREARELLGMARRYYEDAGFFRERGDLVTAFAALNYAHGWLDAGARLGLFKVRDSRLFTVDDA